MVKIIDGTKIANSIADELKEKVALLKLNKINPKLVIIGISPNSRSLVYIKMKQKKAATAMPGAMAGMSIFTKNPGSE